jgi:hypothetical protein
MQPVGASAEFSREGQRLVVRRVVLETPGLLRVEGGCVVEQQLIVGEFDVGVAASALRWTAGARAGIHDVLMGAGGDNLGRVHDVGAARQLALPLGGPAHGRGQQPSGDGGPHRGS